LSLAFLPRLGVTLFEETKGYGSRIGRSGETLEDEA